MAATAKKNIPALRFPQFKDEWVEKTLGDIAAFSKGKGVSKSDIIENGKYECIRYGELYTHYGEVITEIKSRTNLPENELIFSEYNDVIIPASGETQIDIATASCVLKEGVALGGDLNIIKTDENGIVLAYYLNSKKKLEIAALAQGNSVVHLYAKQLQTLSLTLPSLPEQKKIASFLSSVDERLQQLQQQQSMLEQYKKGLLQQVFNQKIRFKDAKGKAYPNWEEKSLGEISIRKGSTISANSLKDSGGKYKVYGATGVYKLVDFYTEEDEYVSIVKDGAGVGRLHFCESKSSVLGTLDTIKSNHLTQTKFLYYFLSTVNFEEFVTGSTIPHIYYRDYSKIKLALPSLEEQTKIANFLSAIDEQINTVKQQIAQTQQFKKGLLQQMFV